MALSSRFYGRAFLSAFNKEIDFDSDAIKVMLTTSAYTPDQDAHRYKSSVTNEVSGTGYTAGGLALAGASLNYLATTNEIVLDGNDTAWTASTITNARYAVIYDSTPATDANRPLIAYVDFGVDKSSAAGTLQITWDPAGIAVITVA